VPQVRAALDLAMDVAFRYRRPRASGIPNAGVDNAVVIPGDGIAMPIRPELRPLYPPHWRELSSHVRFERAEGRCQRCGRPHLVLLRCLPDGRWFDEQAATWRDRRGRPARWPDLMEAPRFRMTRVVLAAAHLDCDPTNNRLKNLRALCQRCHMLQDRPHHLAQRWITYRRRSAVGDLFLGPYPATIAAPTSKNRKNRFASRAGGRGRPVGV
jgi:hypothetical protein